MLNTYRGIKNLAEMAREKYCFNFLPIARRSTVNMVMQAGCKPLAAGPRRKGLDILKRTCSVFSFGY